MLCNAVTFIGKVHWSQVCAKNSTESQGCKKLEYAAEITGNAVISTPQFAVHRRSDSLGNGAKHAIKHCGGNYLKLHSCRLQEM